MPPRWPTCSACWAIRAGCASSSSCLRTPLAVSDIADRLGLSVSLVSHHLRLLKGARLVRADRQGKQVYYEADDAHVRRMVEDMVTHVAEH